VTSVNIHEKITHWRQNLEHPTKVHNPCTYAYRNYSKRIQQFEVQTSVSSHNFPGFQVHRAMNNVDIEIAADDSDNKVKYDDDENVPKTQA